MNFDSNKSREEALEEMRYALTHPDTNEPEPESLFSIKPAYDWAVEAAQRPDPVSLWDAFWYEGEVCCLFADSNLGKSIYAVQIANHIAQSQRVIYMDFELSDKQFQLRYTDDAGRIYPFTRNFLRAEINPRVIRGNVDWEAMIMDEIQKSAEKYDAKVLIVDNITYLNSVTEKPDAASELMMSLMDLKRRYGLSLLVLAHTPKRATSSPITQNDLAGSKKLYNFFDSAFAIGRSAKDDNLRYIKQVKVRHGAYDYGENNVIMAEIIKEGAFLRFSYLGNASEREHLKEQTEKVVSEQVQKIMEYRNSGKSLKEIAELTGLTKGRVGQIVRKNSNLLIS